MLFNEKNKEVFRSLLKYLKQYIKMSDKETLINSLPSILNAMLTLD